MCVCRLAVDSDDAVMVGSVNMLSSPPAQTGTPYGKDMTSTPPSSPSVSASLSGAGYEKLCIAQMLKNPDLCPRQQCHFYEK